MTNKITFTLREIRKKKPCKGGWQTLWKGLGGIKKYGEDTPITLRQLYDIIGYEDTFWCLRTTSPETHSLWRHFAVDCAKMVEHLMTDERSRQALTIARRYADGEATDEELDAARAAAWGAAWGAGDAARAAAWGARAAWSAAGDAAGDAAWDAARAAAWGAAWGAGDAARAAAWGARAAAWDAQICLLEIYCKHGKRPDNSEQLLEDLIDKHVGQQQ